MLLTTAGVVLSTFLRPRAICLSLHCTFAVSCSRRDKKDSPWCAEQCL